MYSLIALHIVVQLVKSTVPSSKMTDLAKPFSKQAACLQRSNPVGGAMQEQQRNPELRSVRKRPLAASANLIIGMQRNFRMA
jgi:hypothetical protein